MSEKWNLPKPKILIILVLIACVVIVMSIPRFDVRFFWPIYLLLIPLCTDGVAEFFRMIRFPQDTKPAAV